jgi:hypothetical protein
LNNTRKKQPKNLNKIKIKTDEPKKKMDTLKKRSILNMIRKNQQEKYKFEKARLDMFLKDNIKLTFNYELLLRLTHNEKKIMVIPKVLYNHVNFREDSLFWNYKNAEDKMNEKEFEFWFNTAKHEFFFNQKREINFIE